MKYQVTYMREGKPRKLWFNAHSVAQALRMARTLRGVLTVSNV